MHTDQPSDARVHFAIAGSGIYPVLVGVFVGVLLISNIAATKLIAFGPIITDGGAFLFPLAYIIGDILSEVYGLKAARRAILLGFVMLVVAAVTFWLVQVSPAADGYENQEAYEAVIGFVPRIQTLRSPFLSNTVVSVAVEIPERISFTFGSSCILTITGLQMR